MSSVNLATIPSNVPSLCIPRAFQNISEKRVRDVFEELNLGEIEKVDIVSKENDKGEKFKRIFVHFRHWNKSATASQARERLLTGNEIKIVYDDPWFWKVSALRDTRPLRPERSEQPRRLDERRPRSDAIVEDTRPRRRPLPRGPTRTISAEMCDAYDYGPNGKLITCVTRKIVPNDYMRESDEKWEHLEPIPANPHSNPMGFPDDCECFRYIGRR